jgi:hypothetical protein
MRRGIASISGDESIAVTLCAWRSNRLVATPQDTRFNQSA